MSLSGPTMDCWAHRTRLNGRTTRKLSACKDERIREFNRKRTREKRRERVGETRPFYIIWQPMGGGNKEKENMEERNQHIVNHQGRNSYRYIERESYEYAHIYKQDFMSKTRKDLHLLYI